MHVHRSLSSVTGEVTIVKRVDMMEDAKGVNREDVGGDGRNARALYSRAENQRSFSEILEPKVYICIHPPPRAGPRPVKMAEGAALLQPF